MKLKKIFLIILVGIGIIILISSISLSTFAYSYDLDETNLFYEEDSIVLGQNIKKYLENVDELLIVNSSFEMSDVLVENYDFLIYFAMDYVLKYYENYQDSIIVGDEYLYLNRDLEKSSTNQYISLEEIYNITDKYFGIRDFLIISDNVKVVNGYVSLIDYVDRSFTLEIDRVEVDCLEDEVFAKVYYKNNDCYVYSFLNQNQVLKLKNIEVLS